MFKRISVHSCDSIGSSSSHKDNSTRNSSSSSSLGSDNSSHVEVDTCNSSTLTKSTSGSSWSSNSNGGLTIAEMVLHGFAENEIIHAWLSNIRFEEYTPFFINAGYDMPTISRMTPEDLTAIGITKPSHRRILKTEIQRLNIADGIPNYKPNCLLEWLKILRLEEYFHILCQQGYDSIDRVTELAWEDLEEVGIKKLGHQKKITLAIKKIQNVSSDKRLSLCANNEIPVTILNQSKVITCPEIISHRPPSNCYQISIQAQCQDVPIKTSHCKQSDSPITHLKTFQQTSLSPNTSYILSRQFSEGPHSNFLHLEGQSHTFQSRGRSLESLEYNDSCFRHYLHDPTNQRNSFNPCIPNQQLNGEMHNNMDNGRTYHGYETDSEITKSHNRYADPNSYEFEGTATLNRPKYLIKSRPIAKIAAKTRQTDPWISVNPLQQQSDLITNEKFLKSDDSQASVHVNDSLSPPNLRIYDSNQIYATLKRRKTPPPPPKRSNSIRSTSRGFNQSTNESVSPMQSPIDERQDQAFATCVKSLASRFSMAHKSPPPPLPPPLVRHKNSFNNTSNCDDCEFPPPPSPLLCRSEAFNVNDEYYNESNMRREFDRETTISSSSSTESMPFANDNIGTIKFKETSYVTSPINHTSPMSPLSPRISPETSKANYKFVNHLKKSPEKEKRSIKLAPQSPPKRKDIGNGDNNKSTNARVFHGKNQTLDPLDDIETMLVNLSNQLDLMLDNEKNGD